MLYPVGDKFITCLRKSRDTWLPVIVIEIVHARGNFLETIGPQVPVFQAVGPCVNGFPKTTIGPFGDYVSAACLSYWNWRAVFGRQSGYFRRGNIAYLVRWGPGQN